MINAYTLPVSTGLKCRTIRDWINYNSRERKMLTKNMKFRFKIFLNYIERLDKKQLRVGKGSHILKLLTSKLFISNCYASKNIKLYIFTIYTCSYVMYIYSNLMKGDWTSTAIKLQLPQRGISFKIHCLRSLVIM